MLRRNIRMIWLVVVSFHLSIQNIGGRYLTWTETELDWGKLVHLREFLRGLELKSFRIAASTSGMELVVTNDPSSSNAEVVQQCRTSVGRWSRFFHHELKDTTGVEACQVRKACSAQPHRLCFVDLALTQAPSPATPPSTPSSKGCSTTT